MDSDSGTYDVEKRNDLTTVHHEDASANIYDPDAGLSESERAHHVCVLESVCYLVTDNCRTKFSFASSISSSYHG